jgi:hypothetical protein
VLNQNVPPKYLARTVLISLGNYPRVFFMQKSALFSNPSPTFGYDPTLAFHKDICRSNGVYRIDIILK